MTDYMDFAMEKATNQRGISAGRSIAHYQAWLWIEGTPESVALGESIDSYTNYGLPQLESIRDHLGIAPAL